MMQGEREESEGKLTLQGLRELQSRKIISKIINVLFKCFFSYLSTVFSTLSTDVIF